METGRCYTPRHVGAVVEGWMTPWWKTDERDCHRTGVGVSPALADSGCDGSLGSSKILGKPLCSSYSTFAKF